MRILIFILALMSAFFVSASEPDLDTLVPAKLDTVPCSGYYLAGTSYDGTTKVCGPTKSENDLASCELAVSQVPQTEVRGGYYTRYYKDTFCRLENGRVEGYQNTLTVFDDPSTPDSESESKLNLYAANIGGEETYFCPPDNYPEHTIRVDNQCAKELVAKDCPAGYHSKKVSQQLGSTECVPKQCPPAGSGENLSSTPMTGGVPFNGGGMYCNDGCAFTVNASQISSSKYAVGTSQGAACGDKPYDNKKLADEGDTGKCTTATNGDVTLLSCPDANPTTPEPDPHNNDDSKVNEDDTPEKPKETCAEGDTSCNLKNVETEIENSINRQIDNDNELHNKKIDADTKNAKAFLNVMDSIDTAILLQTSQDERLHAVTVGKFNELIDAVNGIETGGGGGGGNGTGNGNIGGQDCEGTIEECAGIGSGDGVELPHETKNLEQYAQKYQNWLPDAELPQEKCITLTTGYTACFSFHYIIYFLQALSGLIVLSSLIHSAAIIVRSV